MRSTVLPGAPAPVVFGFVTLLILWGQLQLDGLDNVCKNFYTTKRLRGKR